MLHRDHLLPEFAPFWSMFIIYLMLNMHAIINRQYAFFMREICGLDLVLVAGPSDHNLLGLWCFGDVCGRLMRGSWKTNPSVWKCIYPEWITIGVCTDSDHTQCNYSFVRKSSQIKSRRYLMTLPRELYHTYNNILACWFWIACYYTTTWDFLLFSPYHVHGLMPWSMPSMLFSCVLLSKFKRVLKFKSL